MTSRSRDLDPRVAAVAQAILNARRARLDASEARLDDQSDYDLACLVEDAAAAIAAVDLHDLGAAARSGSRLSAAYMDALRLDLGASCLLFLMRDRGARAFAAYSAAGAGTMTLNHASAQDLWSAVTGLVRAAAGQPPIPEKQEPTS